MSSRDRKLYRDMEKYIAHQNRCRKRNYEIGREGCFRHEWTEKEIQMLLCYNGTDRELAQEIGHSVQAIQIKRNRIKKEISKKLEK